MTSKDARRRAERRAVLQRLGAEVRRLDDAMNAEAAAIEEHERRIREHEAAWERLGDELHEAVTRLVGALATGDEARWRTWADILDELDNWTETLEKPAVFDDPPAWRAVPRPGPDAGHFITNAADRGGTRRRHVARLVRRLAERGHVDIGAWTIGRTPAGQEIW